MRLIPVLLACLILWITSPCLADDRVGAKIGNLFGPEKTPGFMKHRPDANREKAKYRERERIENETRRNNERIYSGKLSHDDYRPSPSYFPRKAQSASPGSYPGTNRRSEHTPLKTKKPEKYYGTLSGESLYPFNKKPPKGTLAADAEKNSARKTSPDTSPGRTATYRQSRPKDPSMGGNKTWNVVPKYRVDTSRFYEDDIAKYRKEHRLAKMQAYCRDGSISQQGAGACSGHGGLLKRTRE